MSFFKSKKMVQELINLFKFQRSYDLQSAPQSQTVKSNPQKEITYLNQTGMNIPCESDRRQLWCCLTS